MMPIRALSLVAQIHEALRTRIAAGDYPPDSNIGIAELARQFNVSATPVREALARLAAEGQVRFIDNIGYSVPPLPGARDYINWAIARVVVESNTLLYIAGPLDPRVLDEAEALNEQIRTRAFGTDHASVRAYSELNWRFHARLIGLAHNPLLDDAHARLYAAPQFSRIFLGRGNPGRELVAAEHAAILWQLRRGDRVAAAAALRDHIIDSLERDARLTDVSVSLRHLVHGTPAAPAKVSKHKKRTTTPRRTR